MINYNLENLSNLHAEQVDGFVRKMNDIARESQRLYSRLQKKTLRRNKTFRDSQRKLDVSWKYYTTTPYTMEGRLEHPLSQVSFATHSTKDFTPVPPRGFIPVSSPVP